MRLPAHLRRVRGLGIRFVGVDVVRGHDLCDLVLLGERRAQERRCREVARPPLVARQRLVRDVADEVLQEAVLAVLGRARVGLQAQHLLAHERGEQRLELLGREPRQRPQAVAGERLAEHGAVRKKPALVGGEAVQPRGDQCVQRLRHLELADLRDRTIHGAVLRDQAAVEEHSHRLDGIQRNAFGALEDLFPRPLGEARHETGEELLHRVLRKRLEVERRKVAQAGAPRGPLLGEIGPREREYEERRVPRPLEQVLDEVEQARVGPLHVLERESTVG